MSLKNISWSILAQCDFYAVEQMVETPDRPAMKTIEPLREPIFRRKILKDSKWKEAYETVCLAYKNLSPAFEICHDNLGGYRLVYQGDEVVSPLTVFRKNPIGYISSVPDGAVTDLSVMSSERTGEQFVLLGPLRFVNSDCNPNCEFDFASVSGIVQLRTKRRINPGDELFVKYGPDFFEYNSCLCRTCDIRKTSERENEIKFDFLLQDNVKLIVNEVLNELQPESPQQNCFGSAAKRRRIRGRELVELYNDITSSPLSDDASPVAYRFLSNAPHEQSGQRRTSDERSESDFSFCSQSDPVEELSDINESEDSMPLEDVETSGNSFDPEEPLLPSDNILPQSDSPPLFESESPLSSKNSSLTNFVDINEKLFEGSQVSVDSARALTDLFYSRFSLSDECSSALHSLVKSFLPPGNKFPSGYSHVNRMKKNFGEAKCVLEKTPGQSICVMNFRYQLRDVVQRNLSTIFNYSSSRKENPNSDLNASFSPIVERTQNPIIFNLLLFSDGVNIKKSTLKKELWPVWIQVADLPPKLRMSRKNIVLAALSAGAKHPN